jgi:ABC-type dipeptide/oligopeptide/nickel transport system permease component
MVRYIIKRLIAVIPVILALTFVVFTIMYMTPGDPTAIILGNQFSVEASEQLKKDLGIDKPFLVQYFNYITKLMRGDFGLSYIYRSPVSEQLAARFPHTFVVVMAAMAFCVGLGLPIGIYSATKPNSIFSNITMVLSLLGVSLPIFWLGLLLILFFLGVLFFVQNGDALAHMLRLKLDLYGNIGWQSQEMPLYLVILSAFAVGMLFAVLYLFVDRMRLSCALIRKNRTIRAQEKELASLRLKERRTSSAFQPAPADKPLPQAE